MQQFDSEKRKALVDKIAAQNAALGGTRNDSPLPVVSLEDFFVGNADYGSLGCNLIEHPGPHGFYARLQEIRARPDVQDVLAEIYEVDDNEWPFSERIYVLSRASLPEVRAWLSPLSPDEVEEGYPFGDLPPRLPSPSVRYECVLCLVGLTSRKRFGSSAQQVLEDRGLLLLHRDLQNGVAIVIAQGMDLSAIVQKKLDRFDPSSNYSMGQRRPAILPT